MPQVVAPLGTQRDFWQLGRMSMVLNLAIALAVVAMVLGGVALFWIARQDDSRAGRLLGILAVALGAVGILWLETGNHWF